MPVYHVGGDAFSQAEIFASLKVQCSSVSNWKKLIATQPTIYPRVGLLTSMDRDEWADLYQHMNGRLFEDLLIPRESGQSLLNGHHLACRCCLVPGQCGCPIVGCKCKSGCLLCFVSLLCCISSVAC